MKVAIMHHSLNSTGGGERVCINLIEALRERGYDVILATTEKTDWNRVERSLGKSLNVEEISLIPCRLMMFGIYQRPLTGVLTPVLRKKADLVINTHGDAIFGSSDITYMHYPVIALMHERPEAYVKYRRSLFWRIYFTPYELTQRILLRLFLKGSLIITNSKFSARAIEQYLGRKATVVNPPVDTKTFSPKSFRRKKPNIVLVVGRFTPEKRYDLIPLIATKCKNAKFFVVGSVSPKNEPYYNEVQSLVEKHSVTNVTLMRDVPLEQLRELYEEASIYLHLMVSEHFGIAVAEAMSAGCVPVIHKSGGAWTEILEAGKYGFGYDHIQDCANTINRLIDSDLSEMRAKVQRKAQEFSEEAFKRKMMQVVESHARLRGRSWNE